MTEREETDTRYDGTGEDKVAELTAELNRLQAELRDMHEERSQKKGEIVKTLDSLEVARLEDQFAEDPDNSELRLKLHVARVEAGWLEFKIDKVSGTDPRRVIPWVARRKISWTEEWPAEVYGRPTPDSWWLKNGTKTEDDKTTEVKNHRICDDGKWRRDVVQEFDVVAVENLAHLCSIVTRMEDVIVYKPDVTGLLTLTIFDQRDP